MQKKRECLRIFGDVPYKDRNTQIITCPKCYNKVSPEYVIEAIAAMRFIDKIVENREVEKVDFYFFAKSNVCLIIAEECCSLIGILRYIRRALSGFLLLCSDL